MKDFYRYLLEIIKEDRHIFSYSFEFNFYKLKLIDRKLTKITELIHKFNFVCNSANIYLTAEGIICEFTFIHKQFADNPKLAESFLKNISQFLQTFLKKFNRAYKSIYKFLFLLRQRILICSLFHTDNISISNQMPEETKQFFSYIIEKHLTFDNLSLLANFIKRIAIKEKLEL